MNDGAVAALGERCFPPLSDAAARVIGKSTSGPLAGTRIDAHLWAVNADPVVVTGVMTDMCVTGMTRELADSGFEVVVVADTDAVVAESTHT